MSTLDNPLWTFALTFYGRPGVPSTFIALQDSLGLDVNIALLSLWLGLERGIELTSDHVEQAAETVAQWHLRVVRPLRGVRRDLKVDLAGLPEADVLRDHVKRTELMSEQIELAALAVLSASWAEGPGSPALALHNLDRVLHVLGSGIDHFDLDAIRSALDAQAASGPTP